MFGIILHLYTGFFKSEGEFDTFLTILILLSCTPYLICLFLIFMKKEQLIILFGAALPLILDLFMHYTVFIRPNSSTAALGLLFMPIWNIIVFMPLGLLIGFCLKKFVFKQT